MKYWRHYYFRIIRNAFKLSHNRRWIAHDGVQRKIREWKVYGRRDRRIVRRISRNIAAFNWANAPIESTDRSPFVGLYAGGFPHERWSRCLFPGQEGCIVPLGIAESMNRTCAAYIYAILCTKRFEFRDIYMYVNVECEIAKKFRW